MNSDSLASARYDEKVLTHPEETTDHGEQLWMAEFHVVSGVVKTDDGCGAAITMLVTMVARGHGSGEFDRVL